MDLNLSGFVLVLITRIQIRPLFYTEKLHKKVQENHKHWHMQTSVWVYSVYRQDPGPELAKSWIRICNTWRNVLCNTSEIVLCKTSEIVLCNSGEMSYVTLAKCPMQHWRNVLCNTSEIVLCSTGEMSCVTLAKCFIHSRHLRIICTSMGWGHTGW